MCGVIGFSGTPQDPEFLFDGLKKLEYRGYDSAGIAMISSGEVYIQRAEGKLANLKSKLTHLPAQAQIGMGHTRWATHGKPSEANAHPHLSRKIVMLHNGIVENFRELRERVLGYGYKFLSETDTEVAAHLLDHLYCSQDSSTSPRARMEKAIQTLMGELAGAFAFGILCVDDPETLYVVKMGSPVVLGRAPGLSLMASGMTALVEHTRDLLVMEDNEYALLTGAGIEIKTRAGVAVERAYTRVSWTAAMMEKGGYRHYMLKEIHDQPTSLSETLTGRVDRVNGSVLPADLGLGAFDKARLAEVNTIHVIACGTSYYSGMLARYFLEEVLRIPVAVELASEYRYKSNTCTAKTLAIAISQSGETADTLHAIKYAKQGGALTLALVNVPGSTIGAACHAESIMRAGPEIGVASTKAFTAQHLSLLLIGLALGQIKGNLSVQQVAEKTESLVKIPSIIEKCLGQSAAIEEIANRYKHLSSMLFIGRGPQYPVALEGALKLKELSYIHAEGYAAGELKHGPIALIDDEMVVVCICPRDAYREKTISNIEEIRARGGRTIIVGTEGDEELKSIADDFITMPVSDSWIQPFLSTIPLQLLAYWIAVHKGTDVDQPRNLAKSVTVE
jgi:glucosamine--fructose-6-phosphate aminotransferase (isomerizing)